MGYPAELHRVAAAHGEAKAALAQAEAERDYLIRQAHRDGKMTIRDIAGHAGMSHQRVAQIVADR